MLFHSSSSSFYGSRSRPSSPCTYISLTLPLSAACWEQSAILTVGFIIFLYLIPLAATLKHMGRLVFISNLFPINYYSLSTTKGSRMIPHDLRLRFLHLPTDASNFNPQACITSWRQIFFILAPFCSIKAIILKNYQLRLYAILKWCVTLNSLKTKNKDGLHNKWNLYFTIHHSFYLLT